MAADSQARWPRLHGSSLRQIRRRSRCVRADRRVLALPGAVLPLDSPGSAPPNFSRSSRRIWSRSRRSRVVNLSISVPVPPPAAHPHRPSGRRAAASDKLRRGGVGGRRGRRLPPHFLAGRRVAHATHGPFTNLSSASASPREPVHTSEIPTARLLMAQEQVNPDEVVLGQEMNGARVVTLNRLRQLNGISDRVVYILAQLLEKWEKDDDAKLVIFKGAGRAFSAGGDLKMFYEGRSDDSCLEVVYRMYWLCYHIHTYKKTTVALVRQAAPRRSRRTTWTPRRRLTWATSLPAEGRSRSVLCYISESVVPLKNPSPRSSR